MGWIIAALVAAALLLIACSACLFALFLPQFLGGRGGLLSGLHPKAIFLLSPDEGWVVGSFYGSTTNFFHYTNGEWFPVDRPEKAPKDVAGVQSVTSIAMASASEGWGISEDGIYRYHNGMWSTWHARGPDERK